MPAGVACERDYRAIRVNGPLPFQLVGALASLGCPLAEVGISIVVVSTYETDYVLVKQHDLAAALDALRRAGHAIALADE